MSASRARSSTTAISPRGDLVAEQGLGVLQLLAGALADRDLEREPPGRERRQLGSWDGRLNTPRGELQILDTPRGVLGPGLRGQQIRGQGRRGDHLHPGVGTPAAACLQVQMA